MSSLLIYGAGGFAREVQQLAADLAADGAPIEFVGFLSDDAAAHGTVVAGFPVLGDVTYLERHAGRFDVALGIGAPALKRRIAARIGRSARGYPALVHPSVVRSERIETGRGFIACAATALTTDIRIGDFVTINLGCTVGHDTIIDSYVTVAPGTNISGNVRMHEGCDIGTGTKIIQGRTIGAWTIVGAGAVVNQDLPADCTAVGLPAKVIKQRAAGWQQGGAQ